MKTYLGTAAAASVLLLLLSACEPPGKPGPTEDPQAQPVDFESIYAQNCTGCHGVDGKNGPGRILNDPLYLAVLPRETLRQILIHGRAGTAMPAWAKSEGGALTLKQIDTLVDGMYKTWGKPIHLPDPPAYAVGDAKGDADAGRKLFARNCYMCHGPGARVGAVTDPAYLSLVSNQMLRTSIIVGRPDLGMPNYRNLKAGKALNNQDVTDLVAFLVSKRPPNAGEAQSAESMEGSGGNAAVGADSGNGPGSKHRKPDSRNILSSPSQR